MPPVSNLTAYGEANTAPAAAAANTAPTQSNDVIPYFVEMTLHRGLKAFFQNIFIGKTTVFFNIIPHIVSVKVRELGMEQ